MVIKSSREIFYGLSQKYEGDELKELFINQCADYLKKRSELRLPLQLIEEIFDFNFHRNENIKHPITTNITNCFKEKGMRILKIRGKYVVRIIKKETKT